MRAIGFHAPPERACRHQPKAILAVFLGRLGCGCGAEIYHATAKTDGAAADAPQRFDSEGLSCEPITENRGRMRAKCDPEKLHGLQKHFRPHWPIGLCSMLG